MCGITGIWSRELDAQRIEADARAAIAHLHHRGPDDEGIWADGSGLVLGFRRLAILDLTELGHQPMRSPDGRYVMVFNGEIYNYAEIKQRLAALGHTFNGTGDTEAILHAFAEWGSDAVKQFIGMFAIALWDTRDRKLELFRDRIGVKPLHWCWDGKTLCFASELKALRDYHWTPEVDRQALGEFLQYGYIAGDRTIYRGVHKLKPGHRLILNEGSEPEITQYWSVLDALHAPLRGSEHDLEAELEALLIDAFRYRMVADVPIGIFLSGGIDSSLVTAILSRHFDQDIRTFTIGFSENSHDESPWAKRVAEHCGSQHTEYILGVDEALQIARSWGALFDEPFGDSSGIPTLLVSRLAGREVKVVLSADGGDEVFAGYNVYENVLERASLLGRIPPPMRSSLSALASLSSPALRSSGGTRRPAGPAPLTAKLHNLSLMLRNPSPGRILDMNLSQWQPEDIRRLIGGYECPRVGADSFQGDPALQISLWDFVHYLPEDILTKVDRTTMAASIEGREPLLDHRICEFGFSLPAELRRGRLGPKHLLRKILYRYVPRELVERPKQGFSIPLRQWLRTELKELVMDHLSESRIRSAGIMDASEVARCRTAFARGDDAAATPLWYLLAFEMWREAWC